MSLCGDRLSCRQMEESTGAAVPQEALPLPRCHRLATRAVCVELETPAPSPGPARPRRPGDEPRLWLCPACSVFTGRVRMSTRPRSRGGGTQSLCLDARAAV